MSAPAVISAAQAVTQPDRGAHYALWARCAPGLEAEAAAELAALGWTSTQPAPRVTDGSARGPGTEQGVVHGEADLAALYRTLWAARTVESVTWRLATGTVETLTDLAEAVCGLDLTWLPPVPFAVRAQRQGEHAFRSPDIARVAGQAIIDTARARTGRRPEVDLDRPATEVRVEIAGRRLRVGLALDDGPLHRRAWRTRGHHAGLRPSTAAALLTLSGWRPHERLLDPMAGGATIPIEAALAALRRPLRAGVALPRLTTLGLADDTVAESVALALEAAPAPPRPLAITGVERYDTHVALARANRRQAGLEGVLDIRRGDATRLARIGPIDVAVSNPPFGRRAGSPRVLAALYRDALARLGERQESGGRVVWLATDGDLLAVAAEDAGLVVTQARSVALGDLEAGAFVLGRALA